jgi:TonB family protein
MLRCATLLVFILCMSSPMHAMEAPCGITTMDETAPPSYLPLARAARVQGMVILMTEIETDGSIVGIRVLSGPAMLQSEAVDFVKSWRANPYSGPRNCALVVTYVLSDGSITTGKRTDPQHYLITGATPPCLCDPPAELGHKRKRFLFF